jgi:uncharacterized protein with PQ loop repeat
MGNGLPDAFDGTIPENNDFFVFVSVFSGFVSLLGLLQLHAIYLDKSAEGNSLFYWYASASSNVTWIIYAIQTSDPYVFYSTLPGLFVSSAIALLLTYYAITEMKGVYHGSVTRKAAAAAGSEHPQDTVALLAAQNRV